MRIVKPFNAVYTAYRLSESGSIEYGAANLKTDDEKDAAEKATSFIFSEVYCAGTGKSGYKPVKPKDP